MITKLMDLPDLDLTMNLSFIELLPLSSVSLEVMDP